MREPSRPSRSQAGQSATFDRFHCRSIGNQPYSQAAGHLGNEAVILCKLNSAPIETIRTTRRFIDIAAYFWIIVFDYFHKWKNPPHGDRSRIEDAIRMRREKFVHYDHKTTFAHNTQSCQILSQNNPRLTKGMDCCRRASVLALQSPPQIDENGIPILKGYRPPFRPGFDARRAVQTPGKPRTGIGNLTPKAASILLAAIRRAFRRHAKASELATDADQAMKRAKVARLFFDMEMELSGHRHKSSKPHSIPSAPSSFPMPDSGNQSVNPATACPASETAITPPAPIPTKPEDTPF